MEVLSISMPVFRISILYIQLENLIDILKIRMEINIGGIMVCILAVNNGISYQKETFIFISSYFPSGCLRITINILTQSTLNYYQLHFNLI